MILVIPRNPGWEARVIEARKKGLMFLVVCDA